MEQYDGSLADRVWQRVRGESGGEPPKPGLRALAAAEAREAAILRMLSGQIQGQDRTLLRDMAEAEQNHAACLGGIHFFTTGTQPGLRQISVPVEAPETALRKCYGRKLRALREYESRISDPEYGHVFAELARQERRHCAVILEIVGRRKR